MLRRISFTVALIGFSALLAGCGDSGKPKGDPSAPPPKGGPTSDKGAVAPPPPAPPPPPGK
jgi:hypothetical protein